MNHLPEDSFYPFVLDHKPGFFLGWFLYRLFKGVSFDDNMTQELKHMHREGTIVYANKYRGHLDYLLYHYRFRRSRLPYPKIAFNLNMLMVLPLSRALKVLKFYTACLLGRGRLPSPFKTGFLREAIQNGIPSLLSLVDPKGFTRRFIHAEKDPVQFLLETQREMERPIFIVPQLILYKKTPEKDHSSLFNILFGFRDKPGYIRKIALFFRYHRRAFIDFARPLDLKKYLESQPPGRPLEELSVEIRQMLIESIDGQKRVILGPIMKSRQQFKEKVLKSQRITRTIKEVSAGNTKRLKQLRKRAADYFDEIAADYNVTYVQLFSIALTWLWKKSFQGIDVDPAELATLREWARKGPIIYIPSHKSHIDYLILNYVLFQHHMHVPRIAAGKNLAFWPFGYLFRKAGAFFIRRTFKGARLYSGVFEMYIRALLEEGHPLEFFIEGGRSRSGKLILPKIGFLSILLRAQQEGYCDDLVFIPTSISYDRILEEQAYLKEMGGETKERETFRQFLKARRFLKRKYGKIYIRFGQPVSLLEYQAHKSEDEQTIHKHLASHLIQSINNVTLITPLAVIATAVLTKHRRGFYLHELTATAEILLGFVKRYGFLMATSLNHPEKAIEETLTLLVDWKVAEFFEDVDGQETFYFVDDEKKREMEFYKNSIIHYFISHAFVAVSLLTGTDEVKTEEAVMSDYVFLRDVFRNEFVYDLEEDVERDVDKITAYFLNASFIAGKDGNGGYRLTRLGFDKLPIWAGLAKTFIESYWVASRSMIQQKNGIGKRGDLLKNMSYQGLRFHKLGIIDHLESLSRINFENAIRFINQTILHGKKTPEQDHSPARESLALFSQRLYELSRYRT